MILVLSRLLFTEMSSNPALSNCRVVPQKIGIKWVFLPLCSGHRWNIKLNSKLNGVNTAIWWNTAEFKYSRLSDAELNMNTKSEIYLEDLGWCMFSERPKRFLRMTSFPKSYSPLHCTDKDRYIFWWFENMCEGELCEQSYMMTGNSL